jgi:putative membrane-bound dehydrogenase-like protein
MHARTLIAVGTLALAATLTGVGRLIGQPAETPPPAEAAAPTGLSPTKPLSPEESLRHLKVKPGYKVELAVAEPLIASPVAFDWSLDGRLWIVEMADYPYGSDGKMKPAGRVRVLKDADGDGRYESASLFADNLNFPSGILPWRKGVIVTAAPDILYLEDTNNDGKADKIEVLFTGFTQGNPQLRVCSPTYGLDNWVYVANGLSSKGIVRSAKTGKEVNVAGRDFRIQPDTGEIELEAGQSQFGRRMDDFGDWFGVHNSYPVRHFAIPERYARRNAHATLPNPLFDCTLANPKVYPISQVLKRYGTAFFAQSGVYTSACSVTPARGGGLFESTFDGQRHVLTCEPVHNLVQHLVLSPNGSTFTAGRADDEQAGEFLASDDPWFRPVYMQVGPDGALWVADMYRFMIEHPDWLPAEGKADYAPFYRLGEDRGRIYRITRDGVTHGAGKSADLVSLLASESPWAQDHAQAAIVWSKDASLISPLKKLYADSTKPLVRLRAIAALNGLGELPDNMLIAALSDPAAVVRRQALKLAEPRASQSPAILAAALRLADDADARVRTQLAFSIGEWPDADAGKTLAKLAASNSAGGDVYFLAAILTSAHRHAAAIGEALLQPGVAPSPVLLADLMAMSLATGDRALTAQLLGPIVEPPTGSLPVDRYTALAKFLDSAARQGTSPAKLIAAGNDALSSRLKMLGDVTESARQASTNANATEAERVAAISLLGRDRAQHGGDSQLLAVLLSDNSPGVASAASRVLAKIDRPQTVELLLSGWPAKATPANADVRSVILDGLMSRPAFAAEMLKQVQAGRLSAGDIDAARRQRLSRHADAKVRDLATAIFGDLGPAGRAKVIEAYRDVSNIAGDAARGKTVFTQACAACHQLRGVGTEIGPNLQSVAGWSNDLMLTAIFDPSRSAEPRYLAYTAMLASGEAVYGVVIRDTPAAVTMKGLDGVERTIPRSQIKQVEPANRSLMPDGLEAQVDKQQLADLLAFLRSN